MGKEKHRLRRYIEDIEMIILGIETSCDETSVGVVDGDGFVLSNVVDSINPKELAKGIKNNSNFQNLAEIDVLDAEAAQDTLLLVDQAIDDVSTMRGNLGSFQRNALEANLHSLRVSKENLTASESMLADTDMAQEMSSLVKNQILLSSGTAMLAQANQVPQSVLQLLNSNG